MSGVQLCADGLRDALLDEAEQFGLDIMAGELERELVGALRQKRGDAGVGDRIRAVRIETGESYRDTLPVSTFAL